MELEFDNNGVGWINYAADVWKHRSKKRVEELEESEQGKIDTIKSINNSSLDEVITSICVEWAAMMDDRDDRMKIRQSFVG